MSGKYYNLECFGPPDRERQAIDVVPQGFSWDSGRPFTETVSKPFEVIMDGDGIMMPMFNRGILLWRDDLLAAVRAAGVDNIQAFDAELVDPVHQVRYKDYKAINIIGLVAAADLAKSKYVALSGVPIIDTNFDSLVIDERKALDLWLFRLAESVSAIVVHERVKQQVEKAGIQYLDFVEPKNWMS